jgi:hypothetical protein
VLTRVKRRLKRSLKRILLGRTEPQPEQAPRRRQVWSIGIYAGEAPYHFVSPEYVDNPVLTRRDVSDVPGLFVADPFMVRSDHTWYMFFEVMNRQTRKGQIGLATSENGLKWTYQQIVLAEPFHLSYPYVFRWMNEYYMVPESYEAGSIRLYKAANFPTQWSSVGTLLSGPYLVDASLFRYDNRWWLFTETNPEVKFDTLRLFYADKLQGPWIEHPLSPIVAGNPQIARPGGRVLVLGDTVIRYAQDCYPAYGTQVRAFEIAELTTEKFRESEADESPVLTPSGTGWNEAGMHHIDPHLTDDGRWIASVDGWFLSNVGAQEF